MEDGPKEKRTIDDLTTCSECIKIRILVPKGCRLNVEQLEMQTRQLFTKELLKSLCAGCPLESSEE